MYDIVLFFVYHILSELGKRVVNWLERFIPDKKIFDDRGFYLDAESSVLAACLHHSGLCKEVMAMVKRGLFDDAPSDNLSLLWKEILRFRNVLRWTKQQLKNTSISDESLVSGIEDSKQMSIENESKEPGDLVSVKFSEYKNNLKYRAESLLMVVPSLPGYKRTAYVDGTILTTTMNSPTNAKDIDFETPSPIFPDLHPMLSEWESVNGVNDNNSSGDKWKGVKKVLCARQQVVDADDAKSGTITIFILYIEYARVIKYICYPFY